MARLSPLVGPAARRLLFASFTSLISAPASTVVLASCTSDDSSGTRKCYEQIPAITRPADGRACGERVPLNVNLCERLPTTRCTITGPNRVCISTPGDRGFLVELSPCGTLESLPSGWDLASTYARGVEAERECNVAMTFCDGSEQGGSSGAAGAGAGVAAGAAGAGGAGSAGGP